MAREGGFARLSFEKKGDTVAPVVQNEANVKPPGEVFKHRIKFQYTTANPDTTPIDIATAIMHALPEDYRERMKVVAAFRSIAEPENHEAQ